MAGSFEPAQVREEREALHRAGEARARRAPPTTKSGGTGTRILREALRAALAQPGIRMKGIFLHIFSGSGGLSHAVAAHGLAVVNVDTSVHPALNLLDDNVFQLLVGWLSSGVVAGIWAGTPCNSFSRARRGKQQSPGGRGMPMQLRSASCPEGLPHLMRAADIQAVRFGKCTGIARAPSLENC